MPFSDLRLAIHVVYVVLLVWRVYGVGDEWWPYVLGLAVLVQGTYVLETWLERRAVRRLVAGLASLDPGTARASIDRIWLGHARRTLGQLLRAEGEVEREGMVERFPFTRAYRRAADVRFWVLAGAAASAFVLLLAVPGGRPWTGWLAWVAGSALTLAAGWQRRLTRELDTVLEVSPFGLVELHPDGTRRRIPFDAPLLLRNRPRLRRMELARADAPDRPIALHYARLGFVRLLDLVVEHGGFPGPAAEAIADDPVT